ncbi:hypothetical protein B0H17DRAFT_1199789 [Mycena rosella]|uniref:F-box domain-containing protein n=1 Tax=Mycena rosella TaxID=1033263 RepID=A0AAD7DKY1_MYCRO|nr:hypothetical protein B0H17DRAFT_1199789 [Mycena rosella]
MSLPPSTGTPYDTITIGLLSIPMEIVEKILICLHPRDVIAFSGSCRFGAELVHRSTDQYFWRQLFLVLFDDPRHAIHPSRPDLPSFNWKGELVRRMRAERAAFGIGTNDPASVLETLVSVTEDALPISNPHTDPPPPSRNLEWLENVLRNSHILDASFLPDGAKFGDRLKAYMALSLKEDTEDDLEELRAIRTRSRCFVYDLRNYQAHNNWGPYLSNGKVNWTHVEAIVNVVETNLREQPSEDIIPRPPFGLQAIRARSAPGDYTGPDWAGVEGTWQRYVCFMDYRDLFAFNVSIVPMRSLDPISQEYIYQFSNAHDGPRAPAFFDDRDFREATRLIELTLHLIPRHKLRIRFPSGEPPPHTNPDYPPLYFAGSSRGASGQEATVQGFVFMGQDYVPRWRFTSIHDDEPQWSSEGAQVGHVASAMGVVGAWSAFHHGEGDPAGPFWLWKVSHEPGPSTI